MYNSSCFRAFCLDIFTVLSLICVFYPLGRAYERFLTCYAPRATVSPWLQTRPGHIRILFLTLPHPFLLPLMILSVWGIWLLSHSPCPGFLKKPGHGGIIILYMPKSLIKITLYCKKQGIHRKNSCICPVHSKITITL